MKILAQPHSAFALAVCAALVLATGSPRAALATKPTPVQEAEELAARAKAEFKAGQFEQAAKDFMAAYGRSKKASMVYNAARSYEEAGKLGDASALFRLYLSISDDADGMRDAQSRLERLEMAAKAAAPKGPAVAATPEASPAQPAAEPVKPAAPKAEPPAAEPAKADPPPVAPPQAADHPKTSQAVDKAPGPQPSKAAVWQVGVPSAAAVGGGILLLVLARNASQEVNSRVVATQQDVQAYHTDYDRARTQWFGGAVLTGIGLTGLGISSWLLLRDGSSKMAVVPDATGRGLTVVATW